MAASDRPASGSRSAGTGPLVLTVGHSDHEPDGFARLLHGAGVETVVDVRRYPGSRRHPHMRREALARWLPLHDVSYRFEGGDLGGMREARPDSAHTALAGTPFQGYADHTDDPGFRAAAGRILESAAVRRPALMCAEGTWQRCHRRLLADVLLLLHGADVRHLLPGGEIVAHLASPEARIDGDRLVYDVGVDLELPFS